MKKSNDITKNPYITHASVDNIKLTKYGLAAIYRLARMAGDKEVEFGLSKGRIIIRRKFYYEAAIIPADGDDGKRTGDRHYTLEGYMLLILRYKRIQTKKLQKIQSELEKIKNGIEFIEKQVLEKGR